MLGIGPPDAAGRGLERQAKPYAPAGAPVMPALELIAVVAAADPGEGGRYNLRQPDSVIRRYLRARAQRQGAAAARHPARPLGLLHRDDAAAQVAARVDAADHLARHLPRRDAPLRVEREPDVGLAQPASSRVASVKKSERPGWMSSSSSALARRAARR